MNLAIRLGSDAVGGIIAGAALGSMFGERWAAIGAVLGMFVGVKLALSGWVFKRCGNLPDAEETAKGRTNRIAELEGKVHGLHESLAATEKDRDYWKADRQTWWKTTQVANNECIRLQKLLEADEAKLEAAADALETERTRASAAERLAARAEEDLGKERARLTAIAGKLEANKIQKETDRKRLAREFAEFSRKTGISDCFAGPPERRMPTGTELCIADFVREFGIEMPNRLQQLARNAIFGWWTTQRAQALVNAAKGDEDEARWRERAAEISDRLGDPIAAEMSINQNDYWQNWPAQQWDIFLSGLTGDDREQVANAASRCITLSMTPMQIAAGAGAEGMLYLNREFQPEPAGSLSKPLSAIVDTAAISPEDAA